MRDFALAPEFMERSGDRACRRGGQRGAVFQTITRAKRGKWGGSGVATVVECSAHFGRNERPIAWNRAAKLGSWHSGGVGIAEQLAEDKGPSLDRPARPQTQQSPLSKRLIAPGGKTEGFGESDPATAMRHFVAQIQQFRSRFCRRDVLFFRQRPTGRAGAGAIGAAPVPRTQYGLPAS